MVALRRSVTSGGSVRACVFINISRFTRRGACRIISSTMYPPSEWPISEKAATGASASARLAIASMVSSRM